MSLVHGLSGYGKGCRCSACRKAHADRWKEWSHRTGFRKPREIYVAEREAAITHGGPTMYAKRGCRCDECRDWARKARAKARAVARTRPVPDHVHGTSNGYTNYGCRCGPCTTAHTGIRRSPRR